MSPTNSKSEAAMLPDVKALQKLFDAIKDKGHHLVGPTIRDNAVVYAEINAVDQLPVGWVDQQDNGRYRLAKSRQQSVFAYNVGPQSWKQILYSPQCDLWTAQRDGQQFDLVPPDNGNVKYAFIGVRACELAALAIHDRVLTEGDHADPVYQQLRKNAFIVAVNCTRAGGTCFCASMGTGPRVTEGFDLALTEVLEAKQHYFLVEVGSKAGAGILAAVPHEAASAEHIAHAEKAVEKAAGSMGRKLEREGMKEELYAHFDHPHWSEIADRCLTCGNCTMVCPTCFCVNVEDTTSLTGDQATRTRRWDSCFTVDFSYIHGGSIRATEYSRYRQWLMHKLVYWQDQFGMPGCVGCGRCITWCPVGIDITEEARVIREKA